MQVNLRNNINDFNLTSDLFYELRFCAIYLIIYNLGVVV